MSNLLYNIIYNKKCKYFLINKSTFFNTKKLPYPEKIVLSFNCKNTDIKKTIPSLIALTLITKQAGCFILTKKSYLLFKIWKGYPIGSKITLWKKNILRFCLKAERAVKYNDKNIQIKNVSSFSNNLYNLTFLADLEKHFYITNALPKLLLTLNLKNCQYPFEFNIILHSLFWN